MTVRLKEKIIDTERTYSNAEFETMPKFDERYELIEGKLVQKPIAGHKHGRVIQNLIRSLVLFDPKEKLGECLNDTSFDLGNGWVPAPDLAFVIASRVTATVDGPVKIVPDLVVEVHSPHELDSKKRQEEAHQKICKYQAVGVFLIWVINPRTQTVEVYHPNQPEPIKTLRINDELDGENIIPGFKLKVVELFQD